MSSSVPSSQVVAASPAHGVGCPICGVPGRKVFEKHGCGVVSCAACLHRFADVPVGPEHVSATFGDQYFHGGGAGYPDYLAEGPLLRRRGSRYAALLEQFQPPGTVLDVGAAAGFLMEGFTRRGWSCRGLEPNDAMASHARSRGLDVETGTLEALDPSRRHDVLLMIQVVAHLYDVKRAFAAAAAVTAPGGHWLVETWDWTTWMARLFGQQWHEYSPPSVLQWFSRGSLVRLAAEVGMREVAQGRPSKWIGGTHATSLLAHALGPSRLGRAAQRASRYVPERLAIPYPAADLFWMVLRKE